MRSPILRLLTPRLRIRTAAVALGVLLVFWLSACTNLTDLTEPSCSYAATPSATSFDSQGGAGTLAVKAPGVCAWTVTSTEPWITLTGTRSGSGDGTVPYTVAAHEGLDGRAATLTIEGQSFTVPVSQAGRPAPVCTYAVSPTSVALTSPSGNGAIGITAPAGCEWAAASQTGWITITSGANGSGNGAFGYVVATNSSTTNRSGSMSVAGQTITVSQSGTAPPPSCTYTVSPTSADFKKQGGQGTINVTAPVGCAWTASSQASWITITQGSSGSGNGIVRYAVTRNTSDNDREGRLTVAGRTVTIDQEGDDEAAVPRRLPSFF